MNNPIHTSDARHAKRIWLLLGGDMIRIRGTGEMRYVHQEFNKSVRANDRRNDVPAVLLSRINQLIRKTAANDPSWKLRA